ncbi:hypothetical protein Cgig2_010548 [Carnegiea gigantea]|uniref:protein-serine/threonine phosphatase n=1 Tax=Carnegiea gigantea TaxID=171969 RepID=A0A9Q1KPZ1_9CARY|nr:hypothetical protein Cgig2_010548 [Carnegiea gigantea]
MVDSHRKSTAANRGDDDPEKCRERRRRRIESRRRRTIAAGGGRRSSASSASSGEDAAVEFVVAPEYGSVAVAGRMREMEDAVRVCMELCRPDIAGCKPVHFFGVFDGHGGSHVQCYLPPFSFSAPLFSFFLFFFSPTTLQVAALCKERFHVFLQEELMPPPPPPPPPPPAPSSSGGSSGGEGQDLRPVTVDRENASVDVEAAWRAVLKRTFEKMDEVALNACLCGGDMRTCGCGYHPASFSLTGSTATVAVVTPRHIIVANCGDSRAVLYRRGRAIALSVDHKPDRADELARIEAAGGRVIFMNGARVQGILAMSRAIGDKFLKPVVISEPEITITRRHQEDECLILASDGLWDVISNELACKVACQCLREGSRSPPVAPGNPTNTEQDDADPNSTSLSQSSLAAALLTRLALGRESSDNISVIVVDLKA